MSRVAIVALTAVAAWGSTAAAADWPHWRGPDRNGVSPEAVGTGWPPRKLWVAGVGAGCTSPIIAQGRLFTMGWAGDRRRGDGSDTVCCYEARTGKLLWKQSYPARFQSRTRAGDTGQYGGPLATPSFDPATGRLYTLGVDGLLACWDARDGGRRVWAKNLHAEFKVSRRPDVGRGVRDYGFTCSPLVWGELLVVQVGDAAGTVVAFDKRSAAKRWSSEYRGPAGHCGGIVPTRVADSDALAVLTLTDLVMMRAADGRTLWTHPWKTDFGCNLPTPAVFDNRVLLTSGYNRSHSVLVDVSGRPRQLWRSDAFATVASPVVVELKGPASSGPSFSRPRPSVALQAAGRAFLVNESLQCVDLADGKVLWKGGRFGHGSIIATADGRLLVFGSGRLALVDAKADRYRQLGVVEGLVRGTCYPHLAFADGLIACKDREGRLVCLSVKESGDGS